MGVPASEEQRAAWRDQYARHRVRHVARKMVGYRVRSGQWRPARELMCFDCGAPAREYDHHRGYEGDAALDVQAVCRPCHVSRGVARKELRGPPRRPRTRVDVIRGLMAARRWASQEYRFWRLSQAPEYSLLWVRESDTAAPVQLADFEQVEMAHVAFADAVSEFLSARAA